MNSASEWELQNLNITKWWYQQRWTALRHCFTNQDNLDESLFHNLRSLWLKHQRITNKSEIHCSILHPVALSFWVLAYYWIQLTVVGVVNTKVLCWISGVTSHDHLRKENIRDRRPIWIVEKLRDKYPWWYGNVRLTKAHLLRFIWSSKSIENHQEAGRNDDELMR